MLFKQGVNQSHLVIQNIAIKEQLKSRTYWFSRNFEELTLSSEHSEFHQLTWLLLKEKQSREISIFNIIYAYIIIIYIHIFNW